MNKPFDNAWHLVRLFRPYYALLGPVKWHFIGALASGLIFGAASGFGFPFLAYKVFPLVFTGAAPSPWLLAGAVALLPAAFVVRGISGYANAYLSAYCGVHVLNRIKSDLFRRIQDLPLAFLQRHPPGDLMARQQGDAAAVQVVVTGVANDLIKQPVTFLGALGALAYMAVRNEQLAFLLFALAIIPLCVLPVSFLGRKMLQRAKQMQKNAGSVTTLLHQNLGAAREVRAFNLQAREQGRFTELLDRIARYALKTIKYAQMLTPIIEILSSIGIAAAILYAARARLGLEHVLPLMTALYMTYDPIKKMGALHNQIRRGQASVERIEYILNAPDELPEPAQPVPFDPARTDIVFDHVEFSYGADPVLRDVELTIPAGRVTALVGPSGAGKSTIANLLPRFHEVRGGQLRIGGVDVRQFAKHDLRAHLSIVSQETVLFDDTLLNNIRLGRPDASDAEVEQAARLAHAHEFIAAFPEGYQTRAGDRGLRLSGGQKQRIAIARAFLKNAPLLILDEATSSLDSESEEMVQSALVELVKGKTVVIIAHRFSTIRMADRIVVLEKGRVRTAGTHAELYAADALYRSLYDRQFLA
jgi:subfamily B ATP-binding cassette protein MsbA